MRDQRPAQRLGIGSLDSIQAGRKQRRRTGEIQRNVIECGPSKAQATAHETTSLAFRHTHATLLTDVGESIKTAQAQLGHSDLATTLNLYAHVVPDSQRRAVERVSEALFSIVLKLDDDAKNGRIN